MEEDVQRGVPAPSGRVAEGDVGVEILDEQAVVAPAVEAAADDLVHDARGVDERQVEAVGQERVVEDVELFFAGGR